MSVLVLPRAGELWRHVKGSVYRVICLAVNEADGHEVVVYESAEGGGPVWVRDLAQWLMQVTVKEGVQVQRFTPVETVDLLPFVDSMPYPPTCVPLAEDTEEVPA